MIIQINRGPNRPACKPEIRLSPREEQAVELCCDGVRRKEIAQAMGVSENTIKALLRTAFLKLEVDTREQAYDEWTRRKAA